MTSKTVDYKQVTGFVYKLDVGGTDRAETSFEIELQIVSKKDGKVLLLATHEENAANLAAWSQLFLSAYLGKRGRAPGQEPMLTVYYEEVSTTATTIDRKIRGVLYPATS
jgi:hypothetical protein